MKVALKIWRFDPATGQKALRDWQKVTAFTASAAVVMSLVACGGGAPQLEGVASAAEKIERAKTARFAFNTEFSEEGTTMGEGAIDLGRKRMHVKVEARQARPDLPNADWAFEGIFIGRTIYLKSPGFFPSQDKPWVKIEDPVGAGVFDGEFPDPSQALRILRAAGDFELVGQEQVRDVQTTRYRGKIDTDTELAPVGSVVDAWVDADGYLRRLRFHDGADSATIDFYDFGADIDIQPPPSTEVRELDQQDLFDNQTGTATATIEVAPGEYQQPEK